MDVAAVSTSHAQIGTKSDTTSPVHHKNSVDANDGFPNVDMKKASQAVDVVNKKLQEASTQVVFSFDTKSNRIWLNVVDKTTGKVVSEIPPESIRKIVDDYATAGLNVDKFR